MFFVQAEELDEHNVQQMPPGFHLIYLPFADDFRKIKFDEATPRGQSTQIAVTLFWPRGKAGGIVESCMSWHRWWKLKQRPDIKVCAQPLPCPDKAYLFSNVLGLWKKQLDVWPQRPGSSLPPCTAGMVTSVGSDKSEGGDTSGGWLTGDWGW